MRRRIHSAPEQRHRLEQQWMILHGHHAPHDADDGTVLIDPQLRPELGAGGGSIHIRERLQVEPQRNHGEPVRRRNAQAVGHLTGLSVREDDEPVGGPRQSPLDRQEEPCFGAGEVETPENVPVERVDDHGDAGGHRRQPGHRARLGGVRVYDRGPFATKDPEERQKRTEVPQRREQPGHARDLGDLHAAFPGVVGHVSLVLGNAPGDQARAKASGIEGFGQVHHMHGRSTRVEPCDEPVNEYRGIAHLTPAHPSRSMRPPVSRSRPGEPP